MGRPPKDPGGPATETLSLRLTAEDRALLDRLVRARAEELVDEAVEVTAASFVRTLIRREARARGLLPPPESDSPELQAPEEPVEDGLRTALRQAIEAGVVQSDLARDAGIDRSEVSRFKAGMRGLSPAARKRLAAALGKHVR
ncbi:MAG: hypothetical protein U0359_06020 [Byssovorax sp.]